VGGFSFLQDTPTQDMLQDSPTQDMPEDTSASKNSGRCDSSMATSYKDPEASFPPEPSLTSQQDLSDTPTNPHCLLSPLQLHGSPSPISMAIPPNTDLSQPDLLGKGYQTGTGVSNRQVEDQQGRHSPAGVGMKKQPGKGNKKIKRKAVRPGHNREEGEREVDRAGDANQALLKGSSHHSSHTSIDTATGQTHEEQLIDGSLPTIVGGDSCHGDGEVQLSRAESELRMVAKEVGVVVTREEDGIVAKESEPTGTADNSTLQKDEDKPDILVDVTHTSSDPSHLTKSVTPPISPPTSTPANIPTMSLNHQEAMETLPDAEGHTGRGRGYETCS